MAGVGAVGEKPPPPNLNLSQFLFFHPIGYLKMIKKMRISPCSKIKCGTPLKKVLFINLQNQT
jgi:hypothetical protein